MDRFFEYMQSTARWKAFIIWLLVLTAASATITGIGFLATRVGAAILGPIFMMASALFLTLVIQE